MKYTLPALYTELQAWKGCNLYKQANLVLGDGNPNADIMMIGEAPGKKEDEMGKPFVGASGKLLDELLATVGWKRSDMYITNLVKYRPPDNRDPTKLEKEQCLPWLLSEIEIVRPKIIVPLGRHSLSYFLPTLPISQAHGNPYPYADDITIFPLYHPAAALHNGSLRQTLFDDFKKLQQYKEENARMDGV